MVEACESEGERSTIITQKMEQSDGIAKCAEPGPLLLEHGEVENENADVSHA